MKRLVFCFDGSWNQIDAPHPTNVLFTAESVLPLTADGTAQLIFYDEGVGTETGEKFTGGMFGAGLEKNLSDGYRFLIFNHTPGDEIYIFGFSRGAFTARSFAGLLSNCGILRRRDAARANEAIELYRNRNKSAAYTDKLLRFRQQCSPDICVSDEEDAWRVANVPDYRAGQAPQLRIHYLGVWDTVGSLGIPGYIWRAAEINKKHQFHDTELSAFVDHARHAVAIDERKQDFSPTLWKNLVELNQAKGIDSSDSEAPYQQKWFPGNHGSVGGGGDRRGLSDQALDWIWDGARNAGLKLDVSASSRIYELSPSHREQLTNTTAKPDFDLIDRVIKLLPEADRAPGPAAVHEVSVSARRRWHERPANLPEKRKYRPPTLAAAATALDALDAAQLGLGDGGEHLPPEDFAIHEVKPNETLSALAVLYYHDLSQWPRIFEANKYKLDDPDHIYVGQVLRIPR